MDEYSSGSHLFPAAVLDGGDVSEGQDRDIRNTAHIVPKHPTLANYIKIFTLDDGLYRGYLLNSFVITAITILLVVFVSVLAGYGFSKLQLKGKGLFMACILAAIMIPFQALLNPLYSIMSKLHLLNTIPSMVLIYATFQSPFCIYMMKNAFDMVPGQSAGVCKTGRCRGRSLCFPTYVCR